MARAPTGTIVGGVRTTAAHLRFAVAARAGTAGIDEHAVAAGEGAAAEAVSDLAGARGRSLHPPLARYSSGILDWDIAAGCCLCPRLSSYPCLWRPSHRSEHLGACPRAGTKGGRRLRSHGGRANLGSGAPSS